MNGAGMLGVWIFGWTRCLLVMDFTGAVLWMKPFISFFWSAIESLSVFWLSVDFIDFSGIGGAVCLKLDPDYGSPFLPMSLFFYHSLEWVGVNISGFVTHYAHVVPMTIRQQLRVLHQNSLFPSIKTTIQVSRFQ